MTIRLEHPPLLVRKVERILARLDAEFPKQEGDREGRKIKDVNSENRNEACRLMTGMNVSYLRQIANPNSKIREPSGRVMKNLGVELYVKDKETGEMELVEFMGRCEIDFTDPANPRLIEE